MMKKSLITAGGFLALMAAFLGGKYLGEGSAQGAAEQVAAGAVDGMIPLHASQSDEEAERKGTTGGNGIEEGNDRQADVRINDLRARWNGDEWEYSTDKGETWSTDPPDGVKNGENGGLSFWQGEEGFEDFDIDNWEEELDGWLASVLEGINDYFGETLPEGYEQWNSFFSLGDTIARQNDDGEWEFSDDDGKTWDAEAPEGFSYSKDGTRFHLGNGKNREDLDPDNFELEDYMNELERQYYQGSANRNIL